MAGLAATGWLPADQMPLSKALPSAVSRRILSGLQQSGAAAASGSSLQCSPLRCMNCVTHIISAARAPRIDSCAEAAPAVDDALAVSAAMQQVSVAQGADREHVQAGSTSSQLSACRFSHCLGCCKACQLSVAVLSCFAAA